MWKNADSSYNKYIHKGISFSFTFIYLTFFYGFLYINNHIDHKVVSVLSLTTFLISISICKSNGIKTNSIINFFYISFLFFVFGRFLAITSSILLGINNNFPNSLDELLQLTWMTSFSPSHDNQILLVLLVNSFLLFFTLGYIVPTSKRPSHNKNINKATPSPKLISIFRFVFYFSLIVNITSIIKKIIITMDGGYLALYQNQMNGESSSNIFMLIYYLAFAVLVVNEKNKKKYMLAYLLMAILSGLTGARGGLVTSILTLIYVYFRDAKKHVNVAKLFTFGVLCYVLMNIVFQFSSRSENAETTNNIITSLLHFFYSQGISLTVIGYISFADLDYPIQALLQSFIPMTSRFVSFISPDTPFYHSSITTFISHNANPSLFFNGAGLGSSIIGELYILTFKNLLLYSIISFFMGLGLRKLELSSIDNLKVRTFIISMFPILLFSPRNGFNVLIISGMYISIMMFISTIAFRKFNS